MNNNLFSPTNIMRVINSRRVGWTGDAECMGRVKVVEVFDEETLWKEATWKTQEL
jgi:hypothetical protein